MYFLSGTCQITGCLWSHTHPPCCLLRGMRQKGSSKNALRAYPRVHLTFKRKKKKKFFNKQLLSFDNCIECCGHMLLPSVSYIYFCPHLGEINHYRQNIFSIDCPHQGQVFSIFQIIIGIQQCLSAVGVYSIFGWQELSKNCTST